MHHVAATFNVYSEGENPDRVHSKGVEDLKLEKENKTKLQQNTNKKDDPNLNVDGVMVQNSNMMNDTTPVIDEKLQSNNLLDCVMVKKAEGNNPGAVLVQKAENNNLNDKIDNVRVQNGESNNPKAESDNPNSNITDAVVVQKAENNMEEVQKAKNNRQEVTDAIMVEKAENNIEELSDAVAVEKAEVPVEVEDQSAVDDPRGLENKVNNESINGEDIEVDLVHEDGTNPLQSIEPPKQPERKETDLYEKMNVFETKMLVLLEQNQALLSKLLEQQSNNLMKQEENKMIIDDPLLVVPHPGDEWLQCPECRIPFLREKQEGCRPINCPNCPHVWSICTRNC